MTELILPLILLFASLLGLSRKEPVYTLLTEGAKEGIQVLVSIIPALVLLMTATNMLRTSGAPELLAKAFSPLFSLLEIPPETVLLLIVRPISGSAALAVGAELMAQYGVDSLVGRTAAVMLGSTETTFYTISVYCSAAGIQKTRYTIPAALIADFTGFTVASLSVRLLFP